MLVLIQTHLLSSHFVKLGYTYQGSGPGAVVKTACLENRRSRVRIPLWPSRFKDRLGSNLESCVWRAVSSNSSHHPQEVLLVQFSPYVHRGGLIPPWILHSLHWYIYRLSPDYHSNLGGVLNWLPWLPLEGYHLITTVTWGFPNWLPWLPPEGYYLITTVTWWGFPTGYHGYHLKVTTWLPQ